METVRYIVIEGVIGAGKTSLVHRLHAERGGRRCLELVEQNPFLVGGFYQDMERYAFETEMFFLLARFRQQREIVRALESGPGPVLSDYLFEKNRIFAEITLAGRDYGIWRRLYDSLAPEIVPPDLAVYLRSGTEALLDRIRDRNRPFERDITREYIQRLNDAYEEFFAIWPGPLVTIDVSRLDFVGSEADYAAVRALLEHRIGAIEAGQGELDLTGTRGRARSGRW